jgi:ubiquinone/menaquinone biosynthesis C-methylase UbiE
MITRRTWILAGAAISLLGQEKSVRPGINDNFKSPNVQEWIGRLEAESREPFARRDEIVAATGVKPGDVVADVGAGTGLFTALFAGKVGAGGHVYAVDIALSFLQHISETAARQGFSNVTPVLGRPDSIALPAASLDLAYVCDTYHHFEFPQKSLESIHRALRPNGRLVIVELHKTGERSGHVRAAKDVVEAEVAAAGFRKAAEPQAGLKENYMVVFQKAR